jgi:hypothetical protein
MRTRRLKAGLREILALDLEGAVTLGRIDDRRHRLLRREVPSKEITAIQMLAVWPAELTDA